MADNVIEALAHEPGDLDVAADLSTGELTICGYFPGPTARVAVDQADDVVTALIHRLGWQCNSPVAFQVWSAERLLVT